MSRQQPLPSAWVARRGARRRYVPQLATRLHLKKVDAQVRYYGMHVLGLWPLWMIGLGIVASIWAAGYQDGLQ